MPVTLNHNWHPFIGTDPGDNFLYERRHLDLYKETSFCSYVIVRCYRICRSGNVKCSYNWYISSSALLCPDTTKAKFHMEPPCKLRMKVSQNSSGQLSKMSTRSI